MEKPKSTKKIVKTKTKKIKKSDAMEGGAASYWQAWAGVPMYNYLEKNAKYAKFLLEGMGIPKLDILMSNIAGWDIAYRAGFLTNKLSGFGKSEKK